MSCYEVFFILIFLFLIKDGRRGKEDRITFENEKKY